MESFLVLLISILALLYLRDSLNRYIFQSLVRLIQNNKVATLIFALIFLPGVVLHEFSHWLAAKLLFVKTHRISLLPEWVEGGVLRFGFVELSKTDRIRSALIGLAPIFTGVLVILFIAFNHLHLEIFLEGIQARNLERLGEGIRAFLSTQDVFLWCYFLLTVSNTMLPSPSDRKAWLPAGIAFLILYVVVILIALGSPTSTFLVEFAEEIANTLSRAFGLAVALNLILILPLWGLNWWFRKIIR